MDNVIETHNLTKSFQARQSKDRKPQLIEAVKGIDLVVHEGEIFGFLGPNGAGKTTTLRMLATLIPPSSGQAKIAGYDLTRKSKQNSLVHWLCQPDGGLRYHGHGARKLDAPGAVARSEPSQR